MVSWRSRLHDPKDIREGRDLHTGFGCSSCCIYLRALSWTGVWDVLLITFLGGISVNVGSVRSLQLTIALFEDHALEHIIRSKPPKQLRYSVVFQPNYSDVTGKS